MQTNLRSSLSEVDLGKPGKEAPDKSFLHYSGENWCDGNRTIIRVLLEV